MVPPVTFPTADFPWLWAWWELQHNLRDAAAPRCEVCGATGDLVLSSRETGTTEESRFDDFVALCPRCADRLAEVVDDRCAHGQRWFGMPRSVAVPAVLAEMVSGKLPLEDAEEPDQ